MPRDGLVIRNAEIAGVPGRDARIVGERIIEIGRGLSGAADEIDARGGALIPGLIDHHIHLLATAAQADSLTLDQVQTAEAFATRLRAFAAARPAGNWVRATGYHDRVAGVLRREDLDALAPDHPVRVQHQTGSLWMLNSRALGIVEHGDAPEGLERDAGGRATGRIWRGDAWLATRIDPTPPALAPLGAALAAMGVTGVMDASVSTDPQAAAILAAAHRAGELPQRLGLMSGRDLRAPEDGAFIVGPLKLLLDDHDLPPFDEMVRRVGVARALRRRVAVHCVTAGELALTLAAFETAGAAPGDRIEHGGVIPAEALPVIARLGLTVVTQPGFVFERGDRYRADIDLSEQADLYRCASLIGAGIPVAASSDAPYSPPDPWAAMRAAVHRRTRADELLGEAERVGAAVALGLYLGDPRDPGGPPRRVAAGEAADLCLLSVPLAEALESLRPDLVAATIIAGRIVFSAPGMRSLRFLPRPLASLGRGRCGR
ncbi:MAG TPA: amidohydrolase family protein [Caulobacteraceae bacterium]|jgi:predicted amidohydrolase YtcJ|nr:amidohydrolase family protein [Caulobacteraceae bacterium]